MKIGDAPIVVSVTNEKDNTALQQYLFSIGYTWVRVSDGIKSLEDMCNSETAIYINAPQAEAWRLMFGQVHRAESVIPFKNFRATYMPKIKIDIPNEGVYF